MELRFVLTSLNSLSFGVVRVSKTATLLSVWLLVAILVLILPDFSVVSVVLVALRVAFVVAPVGPFPELKPSFISLSSVFSVLISGGTCRLLTLLDRLVGFAVVLGVGVQSMLRLKRILAVLGEIGVDLALLLVLIRPLGASLLIHISL